MKTLKILENRYVKFSFIIICCYLVASVGVNKVVNPLYYFTASEEHPIDYYSDDSCLYIDLTNLNEFDYFINIYISELQHFGSVVYLYSDNNQDEKTYTLLSNGSNSIKISDLPSNEGIIYIRLNDLNEAELSQITGSVKRKTDIFSMLKVFFSFILLVMFWKFLSDIKKKYTM